jgi:hypothetical protein
MLIMAFHYDPQPVSIWQAAAMPAVGLGWRGLFRPTSTRLKFISNFPPRVEPIAEQKRLRISGA